jgi:2-haloacid dehalogenase
VTAAAGRRSRGAPGAGAALDFDRFDALTFDCYGTLIDWETGIADALGTVLGAHGLHAEPEAILERYARHEAALEAGPYRSYRGVLAAALRGVCAELGVAPTEAEADAFGGSVADWPAFTDSADALERLHGRFGLGVITNCDDDLFAASNRRLGVTFDWIVTAEQARRYKPNPRGFELAFERIGLPTSRILHVAQSLFHDHATAKRLGLSTVWVNRRHDRPGSGATPPAEARPDLVVPDMATLADLATRFAT